MHRNVVLAPRQARAHPRGVAEKDGDTDTVDLLTGVATELEQHGWLLRASLG